MPLSNMSKNALANPRFEGGPSSQTFLSVRFPKLARPAMGCI